MYLTPRALRKAHAAGVLTFIADAEHMQGIARHLFAELPEDRQKLHVPLDAMTLVVRWGGRLGLSTDVRYHGTGVEQAYIRADQYATTKEITSWYSKAEIEENRDGTPTIVELTVRRWDKPQFGARFAEALLGYGGYPHGIISESAQLFAHTGLDVAEIQRARVVAECQDRFPYPLDVLTLPKAQ